MPKATVENTKISIEINVTCDCGHTFTFDAEEELNFMTCTKCWEEIVVDIGTIGPAEILDVSIAEEG